MSHVLTEFYHHVPVDHPQVFMATMFWRREVLPVHGLAWYGIASFCANDDCFSPRIGASVARRRYFALTRPLTTNGVLAVVASPERPLYEDSAALAALLAGHYIRGA